MSEVIAVSATPTIDQARAAIAAIRRSARGMGVHYATVALFLKGSNLSVRKGAEVLSYGKSHLARIVKGYDLAFTLTGEEPEPATVGACVESTAHYSSEALAAILANAETQSGETATAQWDKAVKAFGPPSNGGTGSRKDAKDADDKVSKGDHIGNDHGGTGKSTPQGGDAGPAMSVTDHIRAAIRGLERSKPALPVDVASMESLISRLQDAAFEWSIRD